MAELFSMGKLI